ncbi:hypothetical protein HPB50_008079 [Hyalomma asiaticum]|uniref:Uncharacterized protein n=1 Tax=Hyalomma asiaticum TaxID=266040 RepID=A0ACB7RUZ4_HYAAI|nr:hypothetical protein HPB50_008079 [Hyalomma asiaticum]
MLVVKCPAFITQEEENGKPRPSTTDKLAATFPAVWRNGGVKGGVDGAIRRRPRRRPNLDVDFEVIQGSPRRGENIDVFLSSGPPVTCVPGSPLLRSCPDTRAGCGATTAVMEGALHLGQQTLTRRPLSRSGAILSAPGVQAPAFVRCLPGRPRISGGAERKLRRPPGRGSGRRVAARAESERRQKQGARKSCASGSQPGGGRKGADAAAIFSATPLSFATPPPLQQSNPRGDPRFRAFGTSCAKSQLTRSARGSSPVRGVRQSSTLPGYRAQTLLDPPLFRASFLDQTGLPSPDEPRGVLEVSDHRPSCTADASVLILRVAAPFRHDDGSPVWLGEADSPRMRYFASLLADISVCRRLRRCAPADFADPVSVTTTIARLRVCLVSQRKSLCERYTLQVP